MRHHSCFLAGQRKGLLKGNLLAEAHAAIRTQLAARQPLLEVASREVQWKACIARKLAAKLV